jgi:pimeloyl-ACP methyl ester carboxylesterase
MSFARLETNGRTTQRSEWRRGCLRFLLAWLFFGPISQVASFGLVKSHKNTREVGAQLLWLFKNDPFSDEPTETQAPSTTSPDTPRPHRVQFSSPLLDYGYPLTVEELRNQTLSEKPILLYLPGFDGTYICPFIQYPELGTEFDVWCMSIGMDDRSSFEELKWCVLDFLENLSRVEAEQQTTAASDAAAPSLDKEDTKTTSSNGKNSTTPNTGGPPFWASWFPSGSASAAAPKRTKRPIYLAGESFGGLLASEVALTLLNEKQRAGGKSTVPSPSPSSSSATVVDLQGLVLINPATCYDRSQLAAKGPPVAKLPKLLYPFGLTGLLPLFADEYSIQQLFLILSAKALPSVIDDPMRESYMGRVAFSLPTKLEYMNQGTLEWRLEEWLEVGCQTMESRMRDFQEYHPNFRTLLLVAEKDKTLPSIAEAERLVNLLPKSRVHVVEGAGHASTCGSRMDMTAEFRNAFPELRKCKNTNTQNKNKNKNKSKSKTNNNGKEEKRTAMKLEAANGVGPYFGMEPRYDNAKIGLNPILYWSKDNYQAIRKVEEEREVVIVDDGDQSTATAVYTQIFYQLRGGGK